MEQPSKYDDTHRPHYNIQKEEEEKENPHIRRCCGCFLYTHISTDNPRLPAKLCIEPAEFNAQEGQKCAKDNGSEQPLVKLISSLPEQEEEIQQSNPQDNHSAQDHKIKQIVDNKRRAFVKRELFKTRDLSVKVSKRQEA